ncbi:hypothetical protein ABK040_003822 [Willaertia magna]
MQNTVHKPKKSLKTTRLSKEILFYILNFIIDINDGNNFINAFHLNKKNKITNDVLHDNSLLKHYLLFSLDLICNELSKKEDYDFIFEDFQEVEEDEFNWVCEINDYNKDYNNRDYNENLLKKRKLLNKEIEKEYNEFEDLYFLIKKQSTEMKFKIDKLLQKKKMFNYLIYNEYSNKINCWNDFLDNIENLYNKEIAIQLNLKFFTKIKLIEANITRNDYYYNYKAIVNIRDQLILIHNGKTDDEGMNMSWNLFYFKNYKDYNKCKWQNEEMEDSNLVELLCKMYNETLIVYKEKLVELRNILFENILVTMSDKDVLKCLLEVLPWDNEINSISGISVKFVSSSPIK